jgi:hypothetical protein
VRKTSLRLVRSNDDPVKCPPWCVEHWRSHPQAGNPRNTFTHVSDKFLVTDVDGGQLCAELCQILDSEGTNGLPPLLFVGDDHPVKLSDARALAEKMLELVAQAERN